MSVFVFAYGLLMSFVFSGASYNRRVGRADPAIMTWTGYALVGVTMGISALLLFMAAFDMDLPVASM